MLPLFRHRINSRAVSIFMLCASFCIQTAEAGSAKQQIDFEDCRIRLKTLIVESEFIEQLLYDRITKASGGKDKSIPCALYATWDAFLNQASVEADQCLDFDSSQAFSSESAEIGGEMAKLECRQLDVR